MPDERPSVTGALALLAPEQLADGVSRPIADHRVHGGQLIMQSVWVAGRRHPDLVPSSLHGHFLRPGRPSLPIEYVVSPVREGRTLSVVAVRAEQEGKPVFSCTVSLQRPEPWEGDWQAAMPSVPAPGATTGVVPTVAGAPYLRGFEVGAAASAEQYRQSPFHPFWVRHATPLPDDPLLHIALIAWITDIGVSGTVYPPGTPQSARRVGVSLDQTLWFHRAGRLDGWVLVSAESVSAAAGHGLAIGAVYDINGRRLASLAQEGLMRAPGANAGQ